MAEVTTLSFDYSIPDLLDGKNWGRTVGIVLSIIYLFGFPIGTLIGACILWCLIKEWEQGEKMPNGGSDNCGTCAFNQANNGKWGYKTIPFFLYFIIPGILFWLFVRVVLWIIDGFKKDTTRKQAPISKKD